MRELQKINKAYEGLVLEHKKVIQAESALQVEIKELQKTKKAYEGLVKEYDTVVQIKSALQEEIKNLITDQAKTKSDHEGTSEAESNPDSCRQ